MWNQSGGHAELIWRKTIGGTWETINVPRALQMDMRCTTTMFTRQHGIDHYVHTAAWQLGIMATHGLQHSKAN